MTATVQRHGRYTLFETPQQNRILVLGDDLWFAWVGGEQGEILVQSDADHERDRIVQDGDYYLVDFEQDGSFTDVPHLFLEASSGFQEIILPNGLPTSDDTQKRVVTTAKTITRAELERYLASAGGTWSEETTREGGEMRGDRELPIPDYDELSVRGAKPRLDSLTTEELRRLRDYEAVHKQRKTLIHEMERRMK